MENGPIGLLQSMTKFQQKLRKNLFFVCEKCLKFKCKLLSKYVWSSRQVHCWGESKIAVARF